MTVIECLPFGLFHTIYKKPLFGYIRNQGLVLRVSILYFFIRIKQMYYFKFIVLSYSVKLLVS